MSRFTFLGLYSGCGGADIGFTSNGFNGLGAFDINQKALAVHKQNIKCPVYNVDLMQFEWPADFKNAGIDVTFSGAPCQGFSTAGKRLLDDPRNNLLIRGGDIAISLGTKVFVSENVMGSFAGSHKKYWDALEEKFRLNNYKTQYVKVNCLDIGMAQMRKRVLFFAWKGNADSIRWLSPTRPKVLRQVLSNVRGQRNHEAYFLDPADTKFKIASRISEAQKLCNVRGGHRAVPTWNIPEVFGRTSRVEKEILVSIRNLRRQNRLRDFGDADPVHIKLIQSEHGKDADKHLAALVKKGFLKMIKKNHYDLTKTFNGKYRRLCWNEPCPTVDTRFGSPIYFLHPEENRGFTVREAARIQGFSDNFIFSGSLQEQFRMVGNAVPPPLSSLVAGAIREQLLK